VAFWDGKSTPNAQFLFYFDNLLISSLFSMQMFEMLIAFMVLF